MTLKKIAFCHPTGNPNARNALLSLLKSDLLASLTTSFYYNKNSKIFSILNFVSKKLSKEFARRDWVPDEVEKIFSFPGPELLRIFLIRSKIARILGIEEKSLSDYLSVHIDRKFSQVIERTNNLSAIYSYEDTAAVSFQKSKQLGLINFYDLPTLHYKEVYKIQREEADLFPEFKNSCAALLEPKWKIERKEQELNLADNIIVASNATRNSLIKNNISPEKIVVIPYGATKVENLSVVSKRKDKKTFNILYVGRLNPLKGVHYLMEAFRQLNLKNSTLHLVGGNEYPSGWLEKNLSNNTKIKYYGSVPHNQLSQIYLNSDLFIFPSLYEGFGLVVLEALSHGLPVIATVTGVAPDILSDPKIGLLVEKRNIEDLKKAILFYYDDPDSLNIDHQEILNKIKLYSWEAYCLNLAKYLKENIPS